MDYEWDEDKNLKNINIHKLDFLDADLVFENEYKITNAAPNSNEKRFLDFAEVNGKVLALVYTLRDDRVRVISFRIASRKERRFFYEKAKNSSSHV